MVILRFECQNQIFSFTDYIEGNDETLPSLTRPPDPQGYMIETAPVSVYSILSKANVVVDTTMNEYLSVSLEVGLSTSFSQEGV